MFKEHGVCQTLSLTFFEIFPSKYIWMTLTFRVTGSHNRECISSRFRDNWLETYSCHDLDLSRSRNL